MAHLRRQLITAALAANALRPVRRMPAAVPSFFAGWLTTELAPHLLALTLADTAVETARGRASRLGTALALGNAAALGAMTVQGTRSRDVVASVLDHDLGTDWTAQRQPQVDRKELATPWRAVATPFRLRDRAIKVERNISYGPAGKRNLLDVYLPSGPRAGAAPVLLQVHGGAWTIGNKNQQALPLMHRMAARGWVCVAINYRLSPRAAMPAHVIDVKLAIKWIREHIAEFGGDPDYIAITGGSAGGHLAALAALTPNAPEFQPGFEDVDTAVQVAVPHYGVYDLAGSTGTKAALALRDKFLAPRVFKTTWQENPEIFEQCSPILRITPEAPDFFVLHGSNDTLVPVEQGRLFVDRLREVSKSTVAYSELPGAQHAFDVFVSARSSHVVRAVERYLVWHRNRHRANRLSEAAPGSAPQPRS